MILKKYLGKLGFAVVEASNGREGLERLREMTQTDVVLVDWNMPEMDGLDFVRAVCADCGYDVIPLVMVTTNTELENVAEALSAGANEYIIKPFTLDMVREKLELMGIVKT